MFVLFIFLLYFDVYTEGNVLEVTKSGMLALKQSDMVIIFYVTVRHHGKQPVRTMVTVVDCCEKITEDETDCDLMQLHGGDFGILKPGTEKNLSLLYPNIYGYNRKGVCTVQLLYHRLESTDNKDIIHQIEFDTTVSDEFVPQALKGWYNPQTFIPCQSPDQDPFDHCNPVDCHLKYSGNRNYYNRTRKLCQKVPACLTDPGKDFPNVAYVPFSNTCKNLENTTSAEEIKLLFENENTFQPGKPSMINIRCHHGEIDSRTGLCICDRGWKSAPYDPEEMTSNQSYYPMCNIECARDDMYAIYPPLLGLLLGFWLSFCVICCEKYNWFFLCYRTDSCRSQYGAYYPLSGDNNKSGRFHELNPTKTAYGVSDLSKPKCKISQKTRLVLKS